MALGKYEINVDVEPGDELLDDEQNSMRITSDELTSRVKSAVTKRKGRGFSSADDAHGLGSINQFDTLKTEEAMSGSAQKSVEGWVIFVTGIHEEATEDDVHDKFADFGPIKDLKMNLDHRTGYVKGYALIEYASYLEARAAVDNMNGTLLLEMPIKCDFAFTRPPPPNRTGTGSRRVLSTNYRR